MTDTNVDEWVSFFRDAGIPQNVSVSYASSFCRNRIHLNMVLELNRELLKELGVTLIGDAIAILRHARSFHEQNVQQKILNLMSSQCQKSAEYSKKIISTTDVASATSGKRFDGGNSSQTASPVEDNYSGTTVACRNGNNQERLGFRQQSQLTPTQSSLQSYAISTSRPVTASSSQTDTIAQNNISVETFQREERQLCGAPALGDTETTEVVVAPCNSSRSQNNLWTSHSEHSPISSSVESSTTLPLRQATVPSRVLEGNYICRRNQGLKRPTQQSHCTKIVPTSHQHAGRLHYGIPNTQTVCQSPIPGEEGNTLQDAPDEILLTPNTKRKRTLSYRSHEQEQFDPNVCLQSIGATVVRQSVYETQRATETAHSDRSQIQESSQLDVGLTRQDVKNEVITVEDSPENHSSFEQQCQLPLHRRQMESQMQICKHVQSQERTQMSKSLPDPESLLRTPRPDLQYNSASKLPHESQSLPLQPSVEPQSSFSLSSKANTFGNHFQNQKQNIHCNPTHLSSTAKSLLASGVKLKRRLKLLQSRSRTPYMPSFLHSSACSQGSEIQRPVSLFAISQCSNKSVACSQGSEIQRPVGLFAISQCSNKSVPKEIENREEEKLAQTVLESDNARCVSRSVSRGLLEDEQSNLSDLNTEISTVRLNTSQLSKPVVQKSASCTYEDLSSHIFGNADEHTMSSGGDAENNLQRKRVPGQIFSRLGVKVEWISKGNNVCNTTVKTDDLPSNRFCSNVKYKINNSKKQKNLQSKFGKVSAVKPLPKKKLLKRKIVFTAFQKDSSIGMQNIVPDQTPQGISSIDEGQPKLRGILKSQTVTSEQQKDQELQEDEQPQKMTADLLLESVSRPNAADLDVVSDSAHFEENSLSNDSTKSEDRDDIYQSTNNYCSDDEQQEEFNKVPASGTSKTVHFGPVCVREFEKNALPSLGETATNSIFSRLGTWRKRI